MLALQVLVFVVSLFVVVKSADYFIDSAERIGLYIGLSPFIIGTVILSIGTSLPELVTSIAAVIQKHSEIVVADVVGSNTTNILLVLGISMVFSKKSKLIHDAALVDFPILIVSAFFLYLSFIDNYFNFYEGIFFLLCIAIYIAYAMNTKRVNIESNKKRVSLKDPLILIVSVVFLNFGSKYTVKSVIEISSFLNIATGVIAATVVALGTSLPELMVSVTAAKKGKLDIAIGNVVGSNIFNVFGVIGVSSIIGTIHIDPTTKNVGIPFMIASSLILGFILQNKKMSKWVGFILIILYFYFVYQFFR